MESTQPTSFVAKVLTKIDAGDDVQVTDRMDRGATLQNYKSNTVQVMLNGQLLLSASGPNGAHGGGNPPVDDGDYYIKDDGVDRTVIFGFDLLQDDQVQVWDLS